MSKTRSILGVAVLTLLLAARAASALVPAHACQESAASVAHVLALKS